jgi:two-component system, cell cycle response regulator
MRILIAEDDAVSRRVLLKTLEKWGHEVVVCSDGAQAWNFLQREDSPQLAILDWMMPEMDGLRVCREVRARAAEPYVYLLLLTAKSQKEDLIVGMEAGADDYLTKPFDAQELRVKLHAGKRVLDLQAELIAAREALRLQATYDPLTGLRNRGAILDVLKQELARSAREEKSVGVLMADVDHFKNINDTFRHQVGDTVLREVAARMRSSIRPYDVAGRYGGEEFLIILPGCDMSTAAMVAERLRVAVEEEPFDSGERKLSITCSLGVASCSAMPETKADWVIGLADTALYQAKREGRNCVRLAPASECSPGALDRAAARCPQSANSSKLERSERKALTEDG